jgi:type II secretory pathway pseudopilin PulG
VRISRPSWRLERVPGLQRRAFARVHAFSLIELLITMVLLIIMSVMLWGFGSPSNQQKQKNRCQENLQKLFLSMEIYASDFNGDFPFASAARNSAEALDVLVPKYTVDTSLFICPGSKDDEIPSGESIRRRRISYAYYMGRSKRDALDVLLSDSQVNERAKSTNDWVFSSTGKPPGNNHHKYGGNFLFADGRLESSSSRAVFPLNLTPSVVLLNP